MNTIRLIVATIELPIVIAFDMLLQTIALPFNICACIAYLLFPDATWYFFYTKFDFDDISFVKILFWPLLHLLQCIKSYAKTLWSLI